MSAKDHLAIIHAVDGATIQNSFGKAKITSTVIGLLNLPTGEIVMADPTRRFGVEDFTRKAFSRKVSPGIYPVVVYTAQTAGDRVLAFAEIRISNEAPSSFVAAKTLYDEEKKRKGFCGYVVNDSTTGFMDAQVFKTICGYPRFYPMYRLLDLSDAAEHNKNALGFRCAVGDSEDGSLSVSLFSVPSGVYYWYWGKDRKGKICCLIADFFTHI